MTDDDGGIIETVVMTVPRSQDSPEGIRYRLAYIPPDARVPAVLDDNHRGRGHHRHLLGEESGYSFFTVDQLLTDFKRDIELARESLQ